jgi:hypothetical protein
VSKPERRRVSRRVVLYGWIAVALIVPWLTGCSPETVEVKGGTPAPVAPENVSARTKQAEKAEAEIFKKTKKLR